MNDLPALRAETIADHIYYLRGHNVILDFDLTTLYGVETRALKQAVRRNLRRFPIDFMFELSSEEIDFVVSQNVIPSKSFIPLILFLYFADDSKKTTLLLIPWNYLRFKQIIISSYRHIHGQLKTLWQLCKLPMA
jgi:hypothetical protein